MTSDENNQPEQSLNNPENIINKKVGPVTAGERIGSIDVLRGMAVLGILMINIGFFALPMAIYHDPSLAGGFTGLNFLVWEVESLFFLQKMMAVFSMLFGAGLILMFQRANAIGKPVGGVYYRRIMWLMLFGLAHGYLLWYGDILFTYALCGLLLFPFRKKSPKMLISLGIIILVFGIVVQVGLGTMNGLLKDAAAQVEEIRQSGQILTPQEEEISRTWQEVSGMFKPSPEAIETEVTAYRGNYSEVLSHRIPITFMMQTSALLAFVLWRALGLMFLGMGLMKLGFFSAERPQKSYTRFVIIGYAIGLPLVGIGTYLLIVNNFDFIYKMKLGNHFNYVGAVLIALAHAGLMITIVKKKWLQPLTERLAAVGRMAFTNYMMQTVILTTIFYGYGLGLFGKLDRFPLLFFVFAVWILQLIISPIWLCYYRFGPLEWLWRVLTYWKWHPFKI